jgi:Flp pilus assembly protein TadG
MKAKFGRRKPAPQQRGRSPFQRFLNEKRGAFAMQFALMIVPLVACTGLAIDGGRAFLARYELESALDAAALAVGSSTGNQATMDALARKYVDANFKAPDSTQVALTVTPTTSMVTVRGTTRLNTYFMPLVGIPNVTISAESEVRRGGSNVEVALMLDITESMLTNDRIGSLKTAANNLINIVVADTQTPFFSRVAIVPWANNVHVGSYADAIRGGTGRVNVTNATWKASGPFNITALTWKVNSFIVSAATWKNGTQSTVAAGASIPTWRNGTAVNVTGTSNTITRQSNGRARIALTSANMATYANGDFVRITSAASGFTSLNNNVYLVANRQTTYFELQDLSGNYLNFGSGTAASNAVNVQECFNSTCQWMITTSAAHNLSSGDYVIIAGVGTGLNTSATVPVQLVDLPSTTTFLVPGTTPSNPASLSYSSGGTVQECFDSVCTYQITTQSAHGLANGDYVRLETVLTGINTTGNNGVALTSVTNTTQFMLPGATLANVTGTYSGTAGRVHECLSSTCPLRVTATSNDFTASDRIYITGASASPSINNASGATWAITNVETSAKTFFLSGTVGPSYSSLPAGGTATKCFSTTCPIQITAAGHGLAANDKFALSGMNGMDINTTGTNYRTVSSVSGATFIVSGLYGQDYGAWTSGGQIKCFNQGCDFYRYTNNNGGTTTGTISNCVTERTGTEKYKDTSPLTAPLGDDYPASGYNTCDTGNSIQPLTSNKTTLHNVINGMVVTGSTAGQLGPAWGWYMLSPNWSNVWPSGESQPHAYGEQYLRKVAVLMTDGDFNTAHCNGVVSNNYGFGTNDEKINCGTADAPYVQAKAICDAMKAQNVGIIIYTVGFEITANSAADQFMKYCATSTAHYFLASNGTELQTAFASIAAAISRLRISR